MLNVLWWVITAASWILVVKLPVPECFLAGITGFSVLVLIDLAEHDLSDTAADAAGALVMLVFWLLTRKRRQEACPAGARREIPCPAGGPGAHPARAGGPEAGPGVSAVERQPLAAKTWGACCRTWFPPDPARQRRRAKRRSAKRERQKAKSEIRETG